jgi:Sulfotransferase family
MTLPNFLIIGAMKSGTTSLYYYLKQHPQIYMSSIKEPNFFALEGSNLDFDGAEGKERIKRWIKRDFVTNIEEYRALFRGAAGETAIGEASPIYLYSPEASYRIRHYVPEAKLIAILRNPVERAYSAFVYMSREGREPLNDFSRALRAEEGRMRDNWEWIWHYKHVGFYYSQLKRYFDVFDRDQIRVYLYEDLRAGIPRVLRDIFGFLEVDDTFVPDTSMRHNVSGTPKSGLLPGFIFGRNPVKTVLKPLFPQELRQHISVSLKSRYLVGAPPLVPEVRRELLEAYRDDVLKLESLIERDLSGWLEREQSVMNGA